MNVKVAVHTDADSLIDSVVSLASAVLSSLGYLDAVTGICSNVVLWAI